MVLNALHMTDSSVFTPRFTSGILTALLYGRRIRSFEDPYYKFAENFDHLHDAARPSLLDISPYCEQYLCDHLVVFPHELALICS